MNGKLLSVYGLKWNPFSAEVPIEALRLPAVVNHFLWRIEQLVRQGGFALITGDPGTGKSVALRALFEQLSQLRDVRVGVLTRPQSILADFYRELGELFGVELSPHNRWAGAKVLRERWQAHIEAVSLRPVLLVDEAQEMLPNVLNELRLLSTSRLDSHLLVTVVLAGDSRLPALLRRPELLPLASRIHVRLALAPSTAQELAESLRHLIEQAGNSHLLTEPLLGALCDHALGNYRTLMCMADELLVEALRRDLPQLDEKLFLELFNPPLPAKRPTPATERGAAAGARRR